MEKKSNSTKRRYIDFDIKKVYRFSIHETLEQKFIRQFFGDKRSGFFVDVGANHPVIQSQTWHLEQIGWNGLLIEPLNEYCSLLREQRTACVAQVACSSPENHGIHLPMRVSGPLSTLNSQTVAYGKKIHDAEQEFVECRTLDSILKKHSVEKIDFLSVDIEGHEMEMFKGFSIEKWKPRLVLLEDHILNHDKYRFMVKHGYKNIIRTGLNNWFIPRNKPFDLTWIAALQKFRKYWIGLPSRKIKYALVRGR